MIVRRKVLATGIPGRDDALAPILAAKREWRNISGEIELPRTKLTCYLPSHGRLGGKLRFDIDLVFEPDGDGFSVMMEIKRSLGAEALYHGLGFVVLILLSGYSGKEYIALGIALAFANSAVRAAIIWNGIRGVSAMFSEMYRRR